MVAAILTKVEVFLNPIGNTFMRWYVRELSTAMIVNNLTLCFPLLLAMYRRVRIYTIRSTGTPDASKAMQNKLPGSKGTLNSSELEAQ
jgi:hypothetical protein